MLNFVIEKDTRFRVCKNMGVIAFPWRSQGSPHELSIATVILHNYQQETSTVYDARVGLRDQLVLLMCYRLSRQFCWYWLRFLLCLRVSLHLADLGLPWLGWLGQPDLVPSVSSSNKLTEEFPPSRQVQLHKYFSSLCCITFADILLVKASHTTKSSIKSGRALKLHGEAQCSTKSWRIEALIQSN